MAMLLATDEIGWKKLNLSSGMTESIRPRPVLDETMTSSLPFGSKPVFKDDFKVRAATADPCLLTK